VGGAFIAGSFNSSGVNIQVIKSNNGETLEQDAKGLIRASVKPLKAHPYF
jgi:hypothetical protein